MAFRTRLYQITASLMIAAGLTACAASPAVHLQNADRQVADIITDKQEEALGRTEPFTLESPRETLRRRFLIDQNLPYSHPGSLSSNDLEPIDHWPDIDNPEKKTKINPPAIIPLPSPLPFTLSETLQVAAASSRDYQQAKEEVFIAALDLDLERNSFDTIYGGVMSSGIRSDRSSGSNTDGIENNLTTSLSRTLKTGGKIAAQLSVDLVKLLTSDRSSSLGLTGDASISIPLLRGAGRHIAAEPLTLAERKAVYAIWNFERFKRTFAVEIAAEYLTILQLLDRVENSEDNYRSLAASAHRARRMAESGRLPEIQVDQAIQNELRARDNWIGARQAYEQALDIFKITLGLPPDAAIELQQQELSRLVELNARLLQENLVSESAQETTESGAPYDPLRKPGPEDTSEMEVSQATQLALEHRLDLKTAQGQVYDSQRAVIVAADRLRGELNLLGNVTAGEGRSLSTAQLADSQLRFDKGTYAALLSFDLPLERTVERYQFRSSLIDLEQSVRNLQDKEDRIKLEIRNDLRNLMEFREGLEIQSQSVAVAQRRVESTDLFLRAGRAEIRDVLDAHNALIAARNALSAAAVNYRIAELELQRDFGLLEVNEKGLLTEYTPENPNLY